MEQHGHRPHGQHGPHHVQQLVTPSPQPQRFQRHLAVSRSPPRSPLPQQRMVQIGQNGQHFNAQNGCGSGHSVQRMAMAQHAQRQLYPLRQQQQLQPQSVQRQQQMSIPSGLPNRPSTYCDNSSYYVQQQQVQHQQQQLQQRQLQQQQQQQQQQRYIV